jgi:hypothetical protein
MTTQDTVASPPQAINISSEDYREYTYANGVKFRINDPVDLYLLDDGKSHRVVDHAGVTHRPERDWIAISWKPLMGAAPFEF